MRDIGIKRPIGAVRQHKSVVSIKIAKAIRHRVDSEFKLVTSGNGVRFTLCDQIALLTQCQNLSTHQGGAAADEQDGHVHDEGREQRIVPPCFQGVAALDRDRDDDGPEVGHIETDDLAAVLPCRQGGEGTALAIRQELREDRVACRHALADRTSICPTDQQDPVVAEQGYDRSIVFGDRLHLQF